MGYLIKRAATIEAEWLAQQEAARKRREEEEKEKARETLNLPSPGVAIAGAGLGFLGSRAIQNASDAYVDKELISELNREFDVDKAKAMEKLLQKDNVKFLDSLALVPSSINTAHPEMLEAFERLPKSEQINILLRGGHFSPFAYSDQNVIWRGANDMTSAGILAHEYGHILNARDRKGSWTEKLHRPLYNMGFIAPGAATAALATAGLFGASDKTLLYGGLLGSATSLPQIIEELRASHRGAKFLKEHGMSEEAGRAWAGVPSYAINALLPLMPYLTRKAAKGIFGKKKKKKKEDK